MDAKQVEMFEGSNRDPRDRSVNASNIKKHLDSARAKLEYLKAMRHQLKKELAQAIEERDSALREIERLTAANPTRLAPAPESRFDVLRTERASLLRALQEMVAELSAPTCGVDVGTGDGRTSQGGLRELDKAV